jgi:hypothetical protein
MLLYGRDNLAHFIFDQLICLLQLFMDELGFIKFTCA